MNATQKQSPSTKASARQQARYRARIRKQQKAASAATAKLHNQQIANFYNAGN